MPRAPPPLRPIPYLRRERDDRYEHDQQHEAAPVEVPEAARRARGHDGARARRDGAGRTVESGWAGELKEDGGA